ncbi:MAG: hypothetical protein PHG82_00030 [Candidatus Gracilibacteria bacterium]|nr:hypothetical protein [Candidatus Gracilibacteria bacterium]
MNKNSILIIRITLYVIIVILLTIIIYSKYHTPEMDIKLANFISSFHKIPKDSTEIKLY